jgi:hypothetical protein
MQQEATEVSSSTLVCPSSLFDELREQMSAHLESFSSQSAAYNSLKKYAGVTSKTLKAFLGSKSTPYPATIISFYKWLHKTESELEVYEKLSEQMKEYIIKNGYNLRVEKKNITDLICKSTIHYEIYLMTEDQQIIAKSKIVDTFGRRGLEALNELALHEVVLALDSESYTMGKVRAEETVIYYQRSASMIAEMLPWQSVEQDNFDPDTGYTLGNFVASKNDSGLVRKAFQDFQRRLCDIHEKGMKEDRENRTRYVYSTLVYKPISERENP